jgi:hypothetical protein
VTDDNTGRVTTSEAGEMLGLAGPDSARKALWRMGIRPVARNPGRGGESLYERAEIEAGIAARHRPETHTSPDPRSKREEMKRS